MTFPRDQYHLRGNVTYREFIISPDVADLANLDQVRKLAARWALENFPTAEVAIVFHDDNKERIGNGKAGIVHAHVVVNSVDLATGRKVTISNARVRVLHNSLQRIAEGLDLSVQPDYVKGERLQSQQARQRTIGERRVQMRGEKSWKADVRDMALQAAKVSDSPKEFKECLVKADVEVVENNGHLYLIDRDNPTLICRADKLDLLLAPGVLLQRIAANANTIDSIDELREFADAIEAERAQGDEMREQMQAYDRRCDEALDTYRDFAKKHKGMPSKDFPAFKMPATHSEAERQRYEQVGGDYRYQGDWIRDHSAKKPPRAPERHRNAASQQQSHSSAPRQQEQTQQRSQGLSK